MPGANHILLKRRGFGSGLQATPKLTTRMFSRAILSGTSPSAMAYSAGLFAQ